MDEQDCEVGTNGHTKDTEGGGESTGSDVERVEKYRGTKGTEGGLTSVHTDVYTCILG